MKILNKKGFLPASIILGVTVFSMGLYSVVNKDITLVVGGQSTSIVTAKSTVQDLLKEQNIEINDQDKINVKLNDKLKDDMKIEIVEVKEKKVTEHENIPYEVKVIEDKNLEKGTKKVDQEGSEGIKKLTYTYTYHDGKEVNQNVNESIVLTSTDKIVRHGTKEVVKKQTITATKISNTTANKTQNNNSTSTANNTNNTNNTNGKQLVVTATAYASGNRTATGTTPRWGTIAVDPRVIPYGTKVYIPKFNKIFIAEDTGGAIKGNKIDIYMLDKTSAYSWGRKTIEIYIIG